MKTYRNFNPSITTVAMVRSFPEGLTAVVHCEKEDGARLDVVFTGLLVARLNDAAMETYGDAPFRASSE